MIEIWKQIHGYENKFEISNLGNVKSVSRQAFCGHGYRKVKEKQLRFGYQNGYRVVSLYDANSKRIVEKVHRLVACAFILNPNNKPCVNHINGNKADNRTENLEWVTHSENVKHAYSLGLNKPVTREKHGMGKLTTEEVNKIILLSELGLKRKEVAELYNVSASHITYLVRRFETRALKTP